MDTKTMRSLRVYGDENAIGTLPNNKGLHSRNKSSPALSTMAAAAATKLPLKRTAFGDVSNTSRANQPTKDQSTGLSKQPIQPQAEKKSGPILLQPAQRPASLITGLKELAGTNVLSVKPTNEANQKTNAVSAVYRSLSKKNTTLFTDYRSSSQALDNQLPLQEIENAKQALVPLKNDLNQKADCSTTNVAKTNDPEKLRKTRSIQSIKAAKADPLAQIPVPQENPSMRLSTSSAQNDAKVSDATNKVKKQPSLSLRKTPLPGSIPVEQPSKASLRKAAEPVEALAVKHVLPAASEPEEYWDVDYEDEEENYDDDGYVTARSFRSKVDNLTGNVTTTIIPRTNSKVKKELDAAAAIVELSRPATDLEDEMWDVTMVSEYKEEIFIYYKELEIKMAPNPHYMDFQTEIQWSMRSVLMDWVIQVHHRFQLLPETLFLCANLIDRFLSCKVVSLGKLQLVGATAIFIASKYEEINCPSVGEIVYMVDNGYTIEEVLKAERFMLTLLQFDLGWPGPMSFLRRISTADDYDLETRTLAKYFLEITIMDERFLGCPPSFTAAGAHCLARSMLKKGHWSTAHVYYSGYTYSQLVPLLDLMLDCLVDPIKHHGAIYDKYMDKRFKCASQFVKNEMRKGYRAPSVATNDRQTYHAVCMDNSSLLEYTSRGLLGNGFAGLIEQHYSMPPELLI